MSWFDRRTREPSGAVDDGEKGKAAAPAE